MSVGAHADEKATDERKGAAGVGEGGGRGRTKEEQSHQTSRL